MTAKKFSQQEVNRIVALRVSRERESLTKDFENRMKRCMASLHLMLHQELCAMKREMVNETQEWLPLTAPNSEMVQPAHLGNPETSEKTGGERQ